MYVRTSTRRNKSGQVVRYLQLAHNEWDGAAGVSRTKVVYSFGREDELDREAVERLIGSLSRLLDPAAAAALTGPADLSFTDSRPIGGAHVLDGLWRRLGIDAAIGKALRCATSKPGVDPVQTGRGTGWPHRRRSRSTRSWPSGVRPPGRPPAEPRSGCPAPTSTGWRPWPEHDRGLDDDPPAATTCGRPGPPRVRRPATGSRRGVHLGRGGVRAWIALRQAGPTCRSGQSRSPAGARSDSARPEAASTRRSGGPAGPARTSRERQPTPASAAVNRPTDRDRRPAVRVTGRWPGQVHARRYRSRRCTSRVRCTGKSTCSQLPTPPPRTSLRGPGRPAEVEAGHPGPAPGSPPAARSRRARGWLALLPASAEAPGLHHPRRPRGPLTFTGPAARFRPTTAGAPEPGDASPSAPNDIRDINAPARSTPRPRPALVRHTATSQSP